MPFVGEFRRNCQKLIFVNVNKILDSGNYMDLIIKCGNKEFNKVFYVYRNIIYL
jgi:hypothetical protein